MATDTDAEIEAPGIVLDRVPWEVYRTLRDLPGSDRVRMTYHDGTLHLMSLEFIHERPAENLSFFVIEVAMAFAIEIESTGATTLQRRGRDGGSGAGKEPDKGFYLGENAVRMRSKDAIDLTIDPPPDLAIEVIHKADSAEMLAVYARLEVPEVWRYHPRRRGLWFGQLGGDGYGPIARSLALPRLTPGLVLQALDDRVSGAIGLGAWRRSLADWAAGLPPDDPAE